MLSKLKVLLSILVLIVVLLITAIPIIASYQYYFTFTVTNESASDYTNIPVLTGISCGSLTAAGYLTATATDSELNDSDGDDIYYCPISTNLGILIDSLPAYTSKSYTVYMGYSPVKERFSTIIGYSGAYITVDDNSDLELGQLNPDVYQIWFNGQIDVDNISGVLFYKQHAFKIYISSADHVRAAVLNGADAEVLTVTASTAEEEFYLNNSAYNPYWDCNGDGVNDTDDVTYIENVILGLEDANDACDFNFSGTVTLADTTLCERFLFSQLHNRSLIVYADGTNIGIRDYYAKYDLNFDYMVNNDDATRWENYFLSLQSYRSDYDINGDGRVSISDSVAMATWIAAPHEWTESLGAVSVPDTGDDMILNTNNVISSFESFYVTVNGNEDLLIPEERIDGTTLEDLNGIQDGTITYGTNPAGISVTAGQIYKYGDLVTSSSSDSTNIVNPVTMPSKWFATGDIPNFLTPELQEMIEDRADETGIDTQTLYIMMILAIASAVILGIILFTGSIMLGITGGAMVMILGANMNAISGWMIFLFLILTVGIYYLTHQHS